MGAYQNTKSRGAVSEGTFAILIHFFLRRYFMSIVFTLFGAFTFNNKDEAIKFAEKNGITWIDYGGWE